MPAHGHPKGGVLAHPGNRPCTNIIAQVFAFVNPLSPHGDGRLGAAQKSALRSPRAPSGGGRGGGGSRGETDGYCRSYGVAPYQRCGRGTQRNSPGGANAPESGRKAACAPGAEQPAPEARRAAAGGPGDSRAAHRASTNGVRASAASPKRSEGKPSAPAVASGLRGRKPAAKPRALEPGAAAGGWAAGAPPQCGRLACPQGLQAQVRIVGIKAGRIAEGRRPAR